MITSARSIPSSGLSLYQLYLMGRSEHVLSRSQGVDRNLVAKDLSGTGKLLPFAAIDAFAIVFDSWRTSGRPNDDELGAAFDAATEEYNWLSGVGLAEALITDAVGREGRKAELERRESKDNKEPDIIDRKCPRFLWDKIAEMRNTLSHLNGNDASEESTKLYRNVEIRAQEWIAAGLPSRGETKSALESSIDVVMRAYDRIRKDVFNPGDQSVRKPLTAEQRGQAYRVQRARANMPEFGPQIPPFGEDLAPAVAPAPTAPSAPVGPAFVREAPDASTDIVSDEWTGESEVFAASSSRATAILSNPTYTVAELIALPEHPAAALFPMMSESALQGLAADIRENGCREPITVGTVDGVPMLLDGRNRLAACHLAGVTPAVRVYDRSDAVAFIVSQNLRRRDLDTAQRAFIALALSPMIEAESKSRMLSGRKDPGAILRQGSRAPKSSEIAGDMVGVSSRSIEMARAVVKGVPDLRVAVADGALPLAVAAKAARKPAEEQQDIIHDAAAKKTPKVAIRSNASAPTPAADWQSAPKPARKAKTAKQASPIAGMLPEDERRARKLTLIFVPLDDLPSGLSEGRRYRAEGEIDGERWEFCLEGPTLSVGPASPVA